MSQTDHLWKESGRFSGVGAIIQGRHNFGDTKVILVNEKTIFLSWKGQSYSFWCWGSSRGHVYVSCKIILENESNKVKIVNQTMTMRNPQSYRHQMWLEFYYPIHITHIISFSCKCRREYHLYRSFGDNNCNIKIRIKDYKVLLINKDIKLLVLT